MSLEVLRPGFLALLQDYGRRGHREQGMAAGGPIDEHAFLWANRLLGNRFDAAQVESTLGRLQLRFTVPTQFALTGADMDARIDGERVAPWCTHAAAAGAILTLGTARSGLRAYIAVPGGFRVPQHHGSCATVIRERLGGLHRDGRPLGAGDVLPFEPGHPVPGRCVPAAYVPDYAAPLTLRVLPGYQYEEFPAEQRARLFAEEYVVSRDADRMGYRLSGPEIRWTGRGLVSEGISHGAIQVPPDGQPIVLLRDRQTIGGYPKLGCVASLDAARLAQCPPGFRLRFRPAALDAITQERRVFDRYFGIAGGGSTA